MSILKEPAIGLMKRLEPRGVTVAEFTAATGATIADALKALEAVVTLPPRYFDAFAWPGWPPRGDDLFEDSDKLVYTLVKRQRDDLELCLTIAEDTAPWVNNQLEEWFNDCRAPVFPVPPFLVPPSGQMPLRLSGSPDKLDESMAQLSKRVSVKVGPCPILPRREAVSDADQLTVARADYLDSFETLLDAVFQQHAAVFRDHSRLVTRARQQIAAARAERRGAFDGVTTVHNEVCVALQLLESTPLTELRYEPKVEDSESPKRIDFLAKYPSNELWIEVKTIQPRSKNAIDEYRRYVRDGQFTKNCHVIIQAIRVDSRGVSYAPDLAGELFNYGYVARAQMSRYAFETEQRPQELGLPGAVLVYCGDPFRWEESDVLDFCGVYYGQPRLGDAFAKMQLHHLMETKQAYDLSIRQFGYLGRSLYETRESAWNLCIARSQGSSPSS